MIRIWHVILIKLLVIFCWVDLSAQHLNEDVIYHRNGSVVRGKIIYRTQDSIRMETNCNNVFVFATVNLLEIKSEPAKKKSRFVVEPFSNGNSKGVYSYTSIGVLTGNSEVIDDQTFSVHTNIGYEFSQWLGVGIVVGIEHLKTEILPVYLSLKSHLFNKSNSPFVNFKIGYSFPVSKTKEKDEYIEYTYEGGLCLGFDIGVSTFRTKNYAFTITAGYQYQLIKETSDMDYYYWYGAAKEINTYEFNKIAIRIGFLFK